ncbi:MAG: hypothetical protein Ct9H90mP5_10080 [Acidimicrobiaceae bacterium]|nr:MAG: hypothetical protein Ct9H90mP5_10080 [Acidimicrobiaceae bacterium]
MRGEVKFYDELGEATGTGLPDIHFASINSGTAEFVIVMEDLCNLTMVDQAAGMSPAASLSSSSSARKDPRCMVGESAS